jgi:hypothetical protein
LSYLAGPTEEVAQIAAPRGQAFEDEHLDGFTGGRWQIED